MPDPAILQSDTVLSEIDRHFRLTAGPGAGKTYWLTNHVRNVIARSKSLGASQRVVCISYTNVAAGEIIERLGKTAWRVDASTIHSFLYDNVVRPYLWLLRADDGTALADFASVQGHEVHRPMRSFVEVWLKEVSKRGSYLVNELLNKNGTATLEYLRGIRWQYNPKKTQWKVLPPRMAPPDMLPVSKLAAYKRYYWAAGIIDHDDVLYFAHRLLGENPPLRRFLAARFPFVFIDEFQDTSPAQAEMIGWLAREGTIVGVVGDPEQAIFSFQGASRAGFVEFDLGGHRDYCIKDNRRSTKQIVDLLNRVRCDGMQQSNLRNENGPDVELLVGELSVAVEYMEELAGNSLAVLSRRNSEVAALRGGGTTVGTDPWVCFRSVDSGSGRAGFCERLLSACELVRTKRFGEAARKLGRAVCNRRGAVRKPFKYAVSLTPAQRNGLAIAILEYLWQDLESLREKPLADVYGLVAMAAKSILPGLTMQSYRRGKPKDFADSTTIGILIAAISVEEDTRRFRTIHKAKSAEFDSVLVCLAEEERLEHLFAENDSDDEEQRITYVALSRARDRLSIAVPTLSQENEARLQEYPINIVRL